MQVVVSADDFALTYGTSVKICEASESGCVNSVSVVANGYDFDSSLKLLERFSESVDVAVHLNLCEGLPVAPASKVGPLLDERGYLHFSFPGLWKACISGSATKRKALRTAIKAELDAQISKVRDSLPHIKKVNINSHQHFHLMPPVFDELIELNEKHSFHRIRIICEPLFVARDRLIAVRNIFPQNLVKHLLLNFLSKGHASRLRSQGIQYPDIFFGVLYTGFMTEKMVLKALSLLKGKMTNGHFVELLLHPGRATSEERELWGDRQFLGDYYCSEWRDHENNSARAPEVLSLLRELRAEG